MPVYIMILEFAPRNAVALSNATIFGGSIANCILNLPGKTSSGRPLVDWDIILLFEPPTIAGTVLGAYLNAVIYAVTK